MKTFIILITSTILFGGFTSCGPNAQQGALIGGAVGAGTGAIIGHQSGRTAEGALIGGAVGAGTGAAIGNEKDKRNARYYGY